MLHELPPEFEIKQMAVSEVPVSDNGSQRPLFPSFLYRKGGLVLVGGIFRHMRGYLVTYGHWQASYRYAGHSYLTPDDVILVVIESQASTATKQVEAS
jgi:hypothetical protein